MQYVVGLALRRLGGQALTGALDTLIKINHAPLKLGELVALLTRVPRLSNVGSVLLGISSGQVRR